MCTYSMISDHSLDRWNQPTSPVNVYPTVILQPWATLDDVKRLREEVEDLKNLLTKAKLYDLEHDQPDCELDEKVEKLRQIAEIVGIDF